MILTVTGVLVLLALAITIGSAIGRAPLWIAVLLLTLVQMLALFPR